MGESSLDFLGPFFYPHQMKYSLYMITHVYHVVCIVQVKAWILTWQLDNALPSPSWPVLPFAFSAVSAEMACRPASWASDEIQSLHDNPRVSCSLYCTSESMDTNNGSRPGALSAPSWALGRPILH
jgi:hypothetical protein